MTKIGKMAKVKVKSSTSRVLSILSKKKVDENRNNEYYNKLTKSQKQLNNYLNEHPNEAEKYLWNVDTQKMSKKR